MCVEERSDWNWGSKAFIHHGSRRFFWKTPRAGGTMTMIMIRDRVFWFDRGLKKHTGVDDRNHDLWMWECMHKKGGKMEDELGSVRPGPARFYSLLSERMTRRRKSTLPSSPTNINVMKIYE